VPDYWLDFNPWEFPRHDVTVDVRLTLYCHSICAVLNADCRSNSSAT
jgi:hypothetical protein